MASFLTPRDFRNFQLGASLGQFQGPVGDAKLYHLLDKALTKIEDYVGIPLRAHQVTDEAHPVEAASLPTFPHHTPVRGPQSYVVLAWAQQGARQTWTMPAQSVELKNTPGPAIIYGNVMVDRTSNMMVVTSYAGAMGFPWVGLISQGASEILLTYTAGYDTHPALSLLNAPVQVNPTPTVNSFGLPAGLGAQVAINVPITAGGQQSTVSAINGDMVTVSPAFAQAPTPGDLVMQGDGLSLPPPNWLVELQRDTATHFVNVYNAYAGGAAGIGTFQFGGVRWNLDDTGEYDLPQSVKDTLDRRFPSYAAEMA